MKSFADWTDEIRALMNPPAPATPVNDLQFYDPEKVTWDTCNMLQNYQLAESTGAALRHNITIHQALEQQAHEFRTRTGRHSGKSAIRNEWYEKAMEIMANTDYRNLEQRIIQNGTALWGVDFGKVGGDYTVVIHDGIRSVYETDK